VAGNADLGMPILVDRKPMEPGVQQVTFILRDENIAVSGKTRLIVFSATPISLRVKT
jgi:ribonucleotide reductase beta subunit family protein with ferritin-like domain